MTSRTALQCPRCQHWLYVGQATSGTLWGCGYCGGIWMDNQTADHVIRNTCQASLQLAQGTAESARAKVEPTPHQLACPVCRQAMATERIKQAWLDIDRCAQHGCWYDKGELEKVARTAHIKSADWRQAPAPSTQNLAAASGPPNSGDDASWKGDAAGEVAAEVAVEGAFLLFDVLFSLFD